MLTKLNAENMAPVARLDEHDLVLMVKVQLPPLILLYGKVEHGHARLEHRVQIIMVPIIRCDELRAPEAELRAAAAGDEDGGVVDSDGDGLFAGEDEGGVPEGGGWLGVAEEVRVLCVRGRGGRGL